MLFMREIAGHGQIVRTLLNAVLNERVAHAYLFAGPEGVGKATTALAFARALLCARPAAGDACGECRECRQVEHANHPDFNYVRPGGSSIKIEQVREIQRKVTFCSYQGGRKVYLIEQAETMTAEAVNCLLKTLEEPPGGTVFIMLSAFPQALPPTILSRCQQYIFKPIPGHELTSSLIKLRGLAREEARLLAAFSGGSMGKALAYATGSFQKERAAASGLAAALREAGVLEALEMAEKLSKARENILNLLEMLICWYRDILIWRETGEERLLFSPDQVATVKREAGHYETGRLVEAIETIEEIKNKIYGNANTRLALEALFLRLAGGINGARTDRGG
ncbi:MAG: DNA polymerase III subunit tau [Pelotomaculum sp. PtaU1.Bin035]|nr:MAG: DNA polymerase III subunit tau [Pelotomaculum sp. PtaU1.Bin035]